MSVDSATAGAAQQVKSHTPTVSDHSYPHGHLGHLSEYEQGQFTEFKRLAEERGAYKPGPPPSHDDAVLLRFLRARRWVVEDAYKQFKDTEDWREANDIEKLYFTIELDAYEQSRRLYPQWTGRRDKRGIPVYVYEVKTLDAKTVANYEKLGKETTFTKAKWDGKTPRGMLRLFALYENLTRFNQPFCTQLQDREFPTTPITLSTNIVDISGVSLKQFWNLKSHMQSASQLATANYPETLDRIFIIGAPVFFSTVWGWVKRWFDPITVSKIFILAPHEVKPTLEIFIDSKNIPKKYGGELEYNFGELPTVDPAWKDVIAWENGHSSFISGPMIWRLIDDGKRLECIGIGHVDGAERNERICTIPRTWTPPEPTKVEKAADVTDSAKTDAAPVVESQPAEPKPNGTDESAKDTEFLKLTQTPGPAVNGLESENRLEAATDTPAVTTGEGIKKLAISDEEPPAETKTPEISEKATAEASPALPTTVV